MLIPIASHAKQAPASLPGIYEEVDKNGVGCGRYLKIMVYPQGDYNEGVWTIHSEDPNNFPNHGNRFQREPFTFRLAHDVSLAFTEGTKITDTTVVQHSQGFLVPLLFMPFRDTTKIEVSGSDKNTLTYRHSSKVLGLIPLNSEDNWTSTFKRVSRTDPRLKVEN